MKYCKDCVGFDECKTTGGTVEFAVDDGVCIDFDERKPQTNAQKIRSMSDEELAKWLNNFFWGHKKVNLFDIRKWLQQPAEGE